MLRDELSSAKKTRHKQQVKLIIVCVVIVLACLVSVFAIHYGQKRLTAVDTASSTPDPQVTEFVDSSVAPLTLEKQSTAASAEQLRPIFLQQLNVYESTLKPELAKIDLARWDKARHIDLLALEEQVFTEVSVANYVNASRHVDDLQQLAQGVIADSQSQFALAFGHAQQAYDADKYEDAKSSIDQALMFDNSAPQAIELENKINQLPVILPLIQQANIAKVENNYAKELAALNKILQLAPNRVRSAERKRVVQGIINRENFTANIAQSYQAIAQGDPVTARKKLQRAQSIFPQAQEVQDVQDKLEKWGKARRVAEYQQAMETVMIADDWEETSRLLQLILQEQEADKIAQDLLQTAKKIIASHKTMDKLLANPYRLSNKKTLAQAQQNILESNEFFEHSPSLKQKTVLLVDIVEQMNKTLMVEVISDNKTYVVVRGVGIVGEILTKTIQLMPGNYVFEGKRKGFKSKLVKVLLPYTESSYRVTVICDEPI